MGKSCFLSSSNRGVRPPLELQWETQDCSRVAAGYLIGAPIKVQQEFSVTLEMQHGIQGYTQAVAGTLGFLSSCDGELEVPLWHANRASS